MTDKEKIESLESEIVDLRYDLKKSRDKELIYLDILSNIDNSLKVLFNREAENERFNLGETIDHRDSIINLQKSINEYKRVYKLRL